MKEYVDDGCSDLDWGDEASANIFPILMGDSQRRHVGYGT